MQVGFDAASRTVAVERGVDFVPAWLNGPTGSLAAASPDLAAVAEQLDRFDDLTAFAISVEDFSFDHLASPARWSDGMTIIDRPFTSLGTGWSGGGRSARVIYVYAFADEQAAAGALPTLEVVLSADNVVPTPVGEDPLTMGSILDVESIETVGRTIVVTSRPQRSDVRFFPPPFLFHE